MRTIDDVYGLTSLPPTAPFMPPPSMQLRLPMLPPMPYHPALAAMGPPPTAGFIPPIFSPPPMPPPMPTPPQLLAPPPPPPPPPPVPPSPMRLPQLLSPPNLSVAQPATTPSSIHNIVGTLQSSLVGITGAIQDALATLGNIVFPSPRAGRIPVSPIGTGFGMIAPTAAMTREMAYARELLAMSASEIGDALSSASLSRARNVGEIVGSVAGGLILRNYGVIGSVVGGWVGGAVGRTVVDNPLTRALFGAGSERYGDVLRGAAQMQLGTFGNVFLAQGPTTGISFAQSEEIARQLRTQAMNWRFRTRASYEDESRYFQELTQLFSAAGQAGLFLGAGNVDQLMDRFRKILRFSGSLAAIMNDPDIKNSMQQLGQLAMMGMSIDQALTVTTQVGRFARPLGMRAADVFAGAGALGAQVWQQAGLAGGFGMAHGAFAQLMASFGMGALRPTQLQLLGGREGLAAALTQFSAQFAAGAPGSLLMLSGITGEGGLRAAPQMMLANLQRARGISHLAGMGAQNIYATAQQLVASGQAESLVDALNLIRTRQQEMQSELFSDPLQLVRAAFGTAQQIRRMNPRISRQMALQMVAGGDPRLADAMLQIAQNREFQERLMNMGRDETRRAWETQMQALQESSAAFERGLEYQTPFLGIFRRMGRDVSRLFAARQMRLGTEERTRFQVLEAGLGIAPTAASQAVAARAGFFRRLGSPVENETPTDVALRILEQGTRFAQALGFTPMERLMTNVGGSVFAMVTAPWNIFTTQTPAALRPLIGRNLETLFEQNVMGFSEINRLQSLASMLIRSTRDVPMDAVETLRAREASNKELINIFGDKVFGQHFGVDPQRYSIAVQNIAKRFDEKVRDEGTIDQMTMLSLIGKELGYRGRDLGADVALGRLNNPRIQRYLETIQRNALLYTSEDTRSTIISTSGAFQNTLVTGRQALDRKEAEKQYDRLRSQVLDQFTSITTTAAMRSVGMGVAVGGPRVRRTAEYQLMEAALTPQGMREVFEYLYNSKDINLQTIYRNDVYQATSEGIVSPGLRALILQSAQLRQALETRGVISREELTAALPALRESPLGRFVATAAQLGFREERAVQPAEDIMELLEDIRRYAKPAGTGVGATGGDPMKMLYQAAVELRKAAQDLREAR